MAATSTVSAGGALGANVGEALACADACPKIAPMIFPKTLMIFPSVGFDTGALALLRYLQIALQVYRRHLIVIGKNRAIERKMPTSATFPSLASFNFQLELYEL
jgi:hypothetical protein